MPEENAVFIPFEPYMGSNILVIDDDRFVRSVMSEYLRLFGMKATLCKDGSAAMAMLKNANQEFDAIYCDIYLPDMTGHDVLRIARIHHPDTPMVIMTGKPTLDNSIESLRLGASDFLVKPFNSDMLAVTLHRALQFRTVTMENRSYRRNLELLVQARTKELGGSVLSAVRSLTLALEAKDSYTQGHGYRVGELVIKLAKELGVPEEEFQNLRLASELHDIGKIGVPDSVLLKPGKLTSDEYELMKEHVMIGYKILAPIPSLKLISRYVHEHHERMDGKGYPRGITGDQIHYNSRLLIVAEVCDALATERCYKPAWPKEDIIDYFEDHSGEMYDPDVSLALINLLKRDGDRIMETLRPSLEEQTSLSA